MKVYIAAGGWNYEGWHDESIRVFTDKTKADEYAKTLVTTDNEWEYAYDYYEVVEKELQ